MKARILGCGSSGGVPRLGTGWGACDPKEPRNRRSNCSLLITDGDRRILIDTAPDMREQLLLADVHSLDAVFYTHLHADQAHGIDDLRGLSLLSRRRVPVYAVPEVMDLLKDRFDYCFKQVKDYPPILDSHVLEGPVDVAGFPVTPFQVRHGSIDATGYRVGDIGYIPDVSDIHDDGMAILHGVSVLIVDALRYRPHPSHTHVDKTLAWIRRIQPKQAILTNMHVDLDYRTLVRTLPSGVIPAYDGLEVQA
ncbi:MAG TPA: phosphoribosyl 1,2-cyclic phosphodiesterase [Rhodospirillaceae bacterium]|nr:phosphoribosyl 1,2-cyclic phosphodiesterase [Rhodospirillaceae bacterium]